MKKGRSVGRSPLLLVMPPVAAMCESVCLLACPPAVHTAPHPTTAAQAN